MICPALVGSGRTEEINMTRIFSTKNLGPWIEEIQSSHENLSFFSLYDTLQFTLCDL